MSYPCRAWAGAREGPKAAEVSGSRVGAQISVPSSGKAVTMYLEGAMLEILADVDGKYTIIYSGPFPLTKAALIDAFAKLIEDSLKE